MVRKIAGTRVIVSVSVIKKAANTMRAGDSIAIQPYLPLTDGPKLRLK
jgi:hypothetical protein